MRKIRMLAPLLLAALALAMSSVLAYADVGPKHILLVDADKVVEDAGDYCDEAESHGDFVSCVATNWEEFAKEYEYEGVNKGQIMRVIAQSDLGKDNSGVDEDKSGKDDDEDEGKDSDDGDKASVTSVSISASPSSPAPEVGTTVIFTASAQPSDVDAEYAWWVLPPGGTDTEWKLLDGWGSDNSCEWDTTGMAPGTYSISVWARAAGSDGSYEANAVISYALVESPGRITSVSISASPSSPAPEVGTTVIFTASAQPSDVDAEYAWWVLRPVEELEAAKWELLGGWSSDDSYSWDTGEEQAGTYSISVWARAAGSDGPYEANAAISYTLSAAETVASISVDPPIRDPQVVDDGSNDQGNGSAKRNGNGNGRAKDKAR